MKIMIVEDNQKMRQMIRNILNRNIKHIEEILECESGEEAIRQYDSFSPDFVLMDIMLDKMNGLTAADIILQKDSNAKIIIVTQYKLPVYKNKAKSIGVLAYVIKDNLQELVRIIISELP